MSDRYMPEVEAWPEGNLEDILSSAHHTRMRKKEKDRNITAASFCMWT